MQRFRDRAYPITAVTEESLSITSGRALRRLTIGYRTLAADVYWIRALQYYGSRLRAETAGSGTADYQLLYPLLDLTTTLDPLFNIAYRFGSIFLAEPPPGGAGRADLAIRLLEKGLHELPDKWEYMLDIGFVHYWWTPRLQGGLRLVRQGQPCARCPLLAPPHGGNDADGWRRPADITTDVAEHSGDSGKRLGSKPCRMAASAASSARRHPRAAADPQSKLRLSTPSRDWTSLVRAGTLRGIPVDPTGIPYEINSQGRVQLGKASSLAPLPDQAVRQAPPS